MASFFTPRNKSSNSSSSSSARVSPTPGRQKKTSSLKTSAAIVVTPECEVVVWANSPRSRETVKDRWRNTLTYYSFCDDKRFTNLDSLLTQLAPLSLLHICSTEKATMDKATTPAARKKAKQVQQLLQTLQRMIDTRPDLTGDDDDDEDQGLSAPAPTTLAEVHTKFPSVDAGRIDGCMNQLLLPSSKISYRGNVQVASHPWIQKALGFWLQAEGLLSGGMPDDMMDRFHLQQGAMNKHLLLDRTAADCIHLLPPPNAGVATQVGGRPHNNSLLGILSQPARTKMGKRLIEQWLRQPLVDLKEIMYRQDSVHHLVENGVGRDQLRDEGLRNFASMDIGKLAQNLGLYEKASTEDDAPNKNDMAPVVGSTQKALQSLYQLYLLKAQKLPMLLESLVAVVCPDGEDPASIPKDAEEQTMLQSIFVNLQKASNELSRSQELVEAVLDLDIAPREYLIKAAFKDELVDIKTELGNVEASIESCHERMNELWAETMGLSMDSQHVRLETSGDTETTKTYQFRLPNANDTKVLQDQLKDEVKVHRLLKNGVYFSTTELVQLSDKKGKLIAEYDRAQKEVVLDAMHIASTYQGPLERTNELVAQLDALVSLAHCAAYNPHGYCRPTMTDGEEEGMGIKLTKARHPCVEMQENVAEYIPNDINLVFGESSFLLLTGPNMGGKSTYIRALGAIVTMAQIGAYVPCESATINICHHLLARVGAGDLQDRGISTFMAEMLEASSILKTATKRSLIIVDELGRGTSTFDGYGLARSISEYIVQQIGCFSVFATHFHELTQLEETEKSVKNYHVTAQKGAQGLTFMYEVQPGPCLESFGIHVAEMARLPAPVIAEAKRKALELENFEQKKRRLDDAAANGRQDFMTRFKNLPLKSFKSAEEKMAALQQLLVEEQ
ncbi:protein MutS [Seminavis robusta]|uniref:Protein MutS n=1 Tax=Seminavis robusta TaxID=568900 RepID=A0A9N8DQL2_9STRA|nr:protein MutS [Seminavis robusta]|eukprot:Sro301_g111920.1 protein MutS (901) ;mRNA; f:34545-37440